MEKSAIQYSLVIIETAVGKTSSKQFNKFIAKSVAAKSIIRIATLSPSDGHTLSSSDSHTFFVTISQLKLTKLTIKPVKNLNVRQFEVIFKPRGFTPMSYFLGNSSIFAETRIISNKRVLSCVIITIMGFQINVHRMAT